MCFGSSTPRSCCLTPIFGQTLLLVKSSLCMGASENGVCFSKPWILLEYFNEVPDVQTPFVMVEVAFLLLKPSVRPWFLLVNPPIWVGEPGWPPQGRTVTGSQWCAGCGAVGSFCWDLGLGQGPGAVSKIAVIAGMIYPHFGSPLGSSILTHSHVSWKGRQFQHDGLFESFW